ncbi:MAG: EAL domain-containing protein, partial [Aeromonadaceae bacterium]
LCGFEVLMRWRSASGIIGPQHFIPMAEETGLLVEMTRRQIEEAIAALQPLIALQPELKVSFNISIDHLKDEQFVQQSALWRQAIPNLVYEITEGNMVAAHDARLLAALHQLRDHGIRLAVDDFGTGYSSLAYLQSLPLDILKADRCFVAALGSDSVNATILEAIIRLAHRLQLDVVAEGVEEARQVAWLNQQGVTLQQGWCHGYPLPIYEGLLLWRKELSTQLMRPSQNCPRSAA